MRKFGIGILVSMVLFSACAKKKVPYYLFHIGRDAIVTDSTGKVIKDTFYMRVNLGYSYEKIKGIDTVLVPRYVIAIDPARHIKLSMFNGVAGIRAKDLSVLFNFTPRRMTYAKGGYGVQSERLVKIIEVDSGYVIFTSMNIYYIDKSGNEKGTLEVFTSKEYYGFLIVDAYKINSQNFLVIGDQDFGIYNYERNTFKVVKHERPSTRAFFLDGLIMRIEATKRTPYEANYVLYKYNYAGEEAGSVRMPMLKNQYHILPFVLNNILYVLTEKKLYKINPEDFSVVSSVKVDTKYDSIWNTEDMFILYSAKSKKIARIPHDLSRFEVVSDDVDCNHIYVSKWLISCERNDTTFVHTLDYAPLISLKNVLFVKDMFIGTRVKDTLTIYQLRDTFLHIPSPYYTYQRSLMEEDKDEGE